MNIRFAIYGVITALLITMAMLGSYLPQNVGLLSTAKQDNAQWAVFQVETEFARLGETLAMQAAAPAPDSDAVRLRTDIAISRLRLLNEGQNKALWDSHPLAEKLFENLDTFQANATTRLDQSQQLTRDDVIELQNLTTAIQPDVRRLALLGLSLGAIQDQQQRRGFADQLRRFGLIAMGLVTLLTIALIYLDRLLNASRKKDEELNNTADRLSATVAASLDGVIIANAKGEVIDYNPAAETILGWTKTEILGRRMDDTIVPRQHRDAHENGMKRYLASREPRVINAGRIEISALRKSGEEFPIELNVTSATQDGQDIFIAYVRDISEQKINEQKLIDARDQAEKTDRAKSQFLTVMSHEMRTPLNGILGVLDLLKTTRLTKKQDRFVHIAAASGEILLEHVNEALDITRVETGAMSLTPDVFSMTELVTRVTDILRPLAHEKNLGLNVDIDANMDRSFFADAGRFNQILTNLIGNAIKFTDDGDITVKVTGIHGPETTQAKIEVIDSGQGIPKERLDDIFEDFVALAASGGRQNRGDGLGLSISRKVARLMGGELKASSILGTGSTFTLNVPMERKTKTSDDKQSHPPMDLDSKKTILIVEDNAINRSVLREMLVGFGHIVSEAEDGLEGLKMAEDRPFDLIIMDISMPFMDGIETTRRIRGGAGPNASTYILGLTAHGRQEYRTKATSAGMNGFSTKPLRMADLRDALAGIEQQQPHPKPTSDLIDMSVLSELSQALGQQKIQNTIDQFFYEFNATVKDMKRASLKLDGLSISDGLHKLRGAAALLGFTRLIADIDAASAANKAMDDDGFSTALKAAQKTATKTQSFANTAV